MGIAYRIDEELGVTFVVWEGAVTAEQFLARARQLLADPHWPARRRVQLADLRTVTLHSSIDDDTLREAASLYGGRPEETRGAKAAVVAAEAFARAVDFEQLMRQYDPSVIVFTSLGTACTWLGVDAAAAEAILDDLRVAAREG